MSFASVAFLTLVIVVFVAFSVGLFGVYIYVNLPPRKAKPSSAASPAAQPSAQGLAPSQQA